MRIAVRAFMIALAATALFATQSHAAPSWAKQQSNNTTSLPVPATESGLPKSALPGVKFATSTEIAQKKGPEESGVFIVDADTVPAGLPQQLKTNGFKLSPNGVVTDSKGRESTILVWSQTHKVADNKKSGALDRFAARVHGALFPSANAATPHPFRCQTRDYWAVFERGFCRYSQVFTFAEANGTLADGTCGPARPPTRISLIAVQAGFLPRNISRRSCSNCIRVQTMREIHHGCFWPAIGSIPLKMHQINMADTDGGRFDERVEW